MRWRRTRPGDGPFDPGLQVERTWLAWGRTALSFVVVGALLMHTGRSGPGPLGIGPGLAVVATGLVIYLFGRRRHGYLQNAVRTGTAVMSPRWLLLVTVGATASALIGLAVALSTPLST